MAVGKEIRTQIASIKKYSENHTRHGNGGSKQDA